MKRLEDWPERLAAFVEARRAMPFRWGQNDCALFAADAVAAVTGVDLAERWRGLWARMQARLFRRAPLPTARAPSSPEPQGAPRP